MKQNVEPIAVKRNDKLVICLIRIFLSKKCPKIVIETGTYQGLGTTQVVIEAILKSKVNPPNFYTLEPHPLCHEISTKNLEKHSFVEVIRGISVGLQEAIDFVKNDEMLIYHENYPDIVCDGFPVIDYYISEIAAPFESPHGSPEQDVLRRLVPPNRDGFPLFVLDSCGGLGLMEFDRVEELMGDKPYWLMVDDTGDHIKHIRTKKIVENSKDWKIKYFDGRVMVAEKF